MNYKLTQKRKGISDVLGGFFFLILLVGSFAAISIYVDNQSERQALELEMTNQQVQRIHEEFEFGDEAGTGGVCIDPSNNRLFVEVDNTGSDAIEFSSMWILNKSLADEPATLYNINYSDAFVPFSHSESLLLNQPLYMTPGTYDIKLVTTLGIMHVYDDGTGNSLTVGASGTGEFEGTFVTGGSGGLDAPEGLVFGPVDGHLYVSSEKSHQILRYDGTTGAFMDVFAELDPAGTGSDCKKPLGMEFGPDGNLYVASEDNDVVCQIHGTTGAFLSNFVSDGLGGMTSPADVTFGPDGHLYVASEGKNAVYRYHGTTGAYIDKFIPSGISKPKFLMFHTDGDMYVTSSGNNKVVKFDGTTGTHKMDFVVPSTARPDEPEGLIFGPDGHLYVSSEGTDEVVKYDGSTGLFLQSFATVGSGGLDEPADLVFGPNGNLFVASEASDEILEFDGAGPPAGSVPSCDGFTCAGGCPLGDDIGAGQPGASGNLLVSSEGTDEIVEYDNNGLFVRVFVTDGLGGLDEPADLVMDASKNLYVASEATDEVLKYDSTGAFVEVFASGNGLDAPEGLIMHTDGNLYVASEHSDQILRFDGADGDFVDVFAELDPGGTNSDCKKPLGMEFGPDGHLYVASEDMDVICKFNSANGNFMSYFVTDGLGGLTDPSDVAFSAADGNLYVTSAGKNSVYRYDATTGAFVDKFASGVAKPKFLVFGPDGELYTTSEANDKVVQHDKDTGHGTDFVVPSTSRPDKPEGLLFIP